MSSPGPLLNSRAIIDIICGVTQSFAATQTAEDAIKTASRTLDMLIDVIKVIANEHFHLDLFYSNGERRRFDMRALLTIKPWNRIAAPEVFRLARAQYGTVVWPGEIDIDPETLYDASIPMSQPEVPD